MKLFMITIQQRLRTRRLERGPRVSWSTPAMRGGGLLALCLSIEKNRESGHLSCLLVGMIYDDKPLKILDTRSLCIESD